MQAEKKSDNFLTVQVHRDNLSPRTFKVPKRWIMQASLSMWLLAGAALFSSVYAVREYFSERAARPELIKELENEIQELKIALEKRATAPIVTSVTAPAAGTNGLPAVPLDPKATDQKPPQAKGDEWEGKDGVWAGLAENIALPEAGAEPSIKIEDPRVDWEGKYANFTLNILYKDPGKGSQQGHIVAISRANDRIFAHPEGVLNSPSGAYLFDPNRGEYFSVARFRVLKTRFGPFEQKAQLSEIQVFLFDLNNKLILQQNFHYGKK